MVYEWKIPSLFGVDANKAGAELERIYEESGSLEPSQVVEASRPKKAPLHGCFEWDDEVAAEKYRESQARHIIRNITVVDETDEEQEPIRAFVSVQDTYRPLCVVLESRDMTAELMASAMRDLRTFEMKYRQLQQLQPVFTAITEVVDDE